MKKIIVFGATGGTGKQVVEQALQAGMQVTAVVRNPDALAVRHRLLTIVKGDVLIPATFQHEITGKDAVISCLGVPKIQPTTLYSEGMKNIVNAMQQSGVKRIIGISSGAISIPPNSSWIMSFLLKNVLQRFYKPIYRDMSRMEAILGGSNLNWTIVRAPKLTDGRKSKTYRVITGLPLRGIPKISRADLADYLLTHLTDAKTYQANVEVAY